MSFGKRAATAGAPGGARRALDVGSQSTDDADPGLAITVAGFFILLGFIGFFVMATPFTYASGSVRYSQMDLAQSGLSSWMIKAERIKREKRYGLDFSIILTPFESETSAPMRKVADDCLPRQTFKRWVMPGKAFGTYRQATDYLICAMKTERARLCDPTERQRLVDQLMQYKDRRQNIVAVERARAKLMGSNYARQVTSMTQMVIGTEAQLHSRRFDQPLDVRVARGIATLNHGGYLSASDFGWLGLILPVEYAPYLADGVVGNSKCG